MRFCTVFMTVRPRSWSFDVRVFWSCYVMMYCFLYVLMCYDWNGRYIDPSPCWCIDRTIRWCIDPSTCLSTDARRHRYRYINPSMCWCNVPPTCRCINPTKSWCNDPSTCVCIEKTMIPLRADVLIPLSADVMIPLRADVLIPLSADVLVLAGRGWRVIFWLVNLNKNDVEFLLADTTFYCEAPAGMRRGGGGGGGVGATAASRQKTGFPGEKGAC
jgi:hypothetical protein